MIPPKNDHLGPTNQVRRKWTAYRRRPHGQWRPGDPNLEELNHLNGTNLTPEVALQELRWFRVRGIRTDLTELRLINA
jgi:hypothetical protein